MNIDQRQRARRMADRRRPFYRAGLWCCYGVVIASAWAAGRFDEQGLAFPALICVSLICVVTAYALHFDGESRRTY